MKEFSQRPLAEEGSGGDGAAESSGFGHSPHRRRAHEKGARPSLFVDLDRAESAFHLLFLFVRDPRAGEEEQEGFDAVLLQMLRGASLPANARQKLLRIFEAAQRSPRPLVECAADVVRDFPGQEDVLVALLRLILRVCADEGMLSRRHIADLRIVLEAFRLPEDAYECCDPEELQLLELVGFGSHRARSQEGGPYGRNGFEGAFGCESLELEAHYATLGCDADVSDADLRRAYRELAKRYHPDARDGAGARASHRNASSSSANFREVHEAYVAIRRARSRAAR